MGIENSEASELLTTGDHIRSLAECFEKNGRLKDGDRNLAKSLTRTITFGILKLTDEQRVSLATAFIGLPVAIQLKIYNRIADFEKTNGTKVDRQKLRWALGLPKKGPIIPRGRRGN